MALALLLLIVLVAVASRIRLNYYAISPGEAQEVAPLISVPRAEAHGVHGQILLTDVFLSPVTLLTALPDLWSSDTQMIPSAELLGPHTPPAQLTDQGYVEMAQSQAAAKAAAFRQLGHAVPERDAGALVFSVQPGTPAAADLRVGQIIVAVGSVPTPNTCALVAALNRHRPGDAVQLTVEQSAISASGVVESGRTAPVTVRLAASPSHAGASGCPGVGAPHVLLGVQIETQQDFRYPFPVSVDTANIGGPSAGLAMTLGIIDKLSGGRLTGGHTVAATGTIDAAGNVGDVGGVPQKTVAVERAGATVFLVPPQEYRSALSKDVPSLHVYAVASLHDALAVLHRLGGSAVAPPASPVPAP